MAPPPSSSAWVMPGGGGGGGRRRGGGGYAALVGTTMVLCAGMLSLVALRRSTMSAVAAGGGKGEDMATTMIRQAGGGGGPVGMMRGWTAFEAERADRRLKQASLSSSSSSRMTTFGGGGGGGGGGDVVMVPKGRVERLAEERSKALVELELMSAWYRRNVTEIHALYQSAIGEKDREVARLQDKVHALESELEKARSSSTIISVEEEAAPITTTITTATTITTTTLPAWTEGYRFYVLGAVLTRDEHDDRLYADTIVMGRKLFDGNMGSETGVEGLDDRWEKGREMNVRNPSDMVRDEGAAFACIIPGVGEVEAVHVPTATTLDGNVNDIQEIIRCGMPDEYKEDVLVTLVMKDASSATTTTTLIQYVLPWGQRTTGYLSYRPESSRLDPWRKEMDTIHLCVPGTRSLFTCPITDLLIEFVEYHVGVMAVDHIHLGVDYKWGTSDMDTLLKVMRSYIDEGKVSVSSYDVMDGTGRVGSEMKKVYHMNQCLLYTKGLSRFVGIWDTDEMMVPRAAGRSSGEGEEGEEQSPQGDEGEGRAEAPITTIAQVIEEEVSNGPWKHEDLCYLLLTSYGHRRPETDLPPEQLWVGHMFKDTREEEFDHTWQKSILSNRNIYYTGYHLPGACRADRRRWGDTVMYEDAIRVDPLRGGAAMYHYRNKLSHSAPFFRPGSTVPTSEYATHYFPKVLEGISRRGLDQMVQELCGITPYMQVAR